MGNYMSLYGAVKINGVVTMPTDPPRIDANIEKIITIMPASVYDIYGDLTPAFLVEFENEKSLKVDTAYLYQLAGMTTITQVLSYLNALPTEVPFTKYPNLISIDYAAVDTVDVIINDRYVTDDRVYNPSADTTTVYVWCVNWIKQKLFTFTGNQTIAGSYTYFGA